MYQIKETFMQQYCIIPYTITRPKVISYLPHKGIAQIPRIKQLSKDSAQYPTQSFHVINTELPSRKPRSPNSKLLCPLALFQNLRLFYDKPWNIFLCASESRTVTIRIPQVLSFSAADEPAESSMCVLKEDASVSLSLQHSVPVKRVV